MSVINDLSYDQRVHKVCTSLLDDGHEVLLIGRKKNDSVPIQRNYQTKRMNLAFERGALFYASFNLRLFFLLLFTKADSLHSNDLDTLLANYLVAKIKRIPLIYDTHEYFTGVPEIQKRKRVKQIWEKIESFVFPNLEYIFTVNDAIAELYKKDFNKSLSVIRNIPSVQQNISFSDRESLGLPENRKIIVLQGAGINIDRGAEELLEAMVQIDALLLVIGSGDVIDDLRLRSQKDDLKNKVKILGRMPYDQMMAYTAVADVGVTLDKNSNINYQNSLPNKLFDYIRAEIAVVSSPIKEIEKIVKKYEIGAITKEVSPLSIAETMKQLLSDDERLLEYKTNSKAASKQLSWEKEVSSMLEVYKSLT